MDDWFQLHSLIVGYLNTFEYAISTEGDKRLQVHYRRYVTSESCRLAETSKFSGEKRLCGLNRQAEEVRHELGRFKLLSDMKRREREEAEGSQLDSLYSKASTTYKELQKKKALE